MRALPSCLAALTIASTVWIGATEVLAQDKPPTVQMIPASFADIAEILSPAVVNISSTQKTVVPKDFPEMPQFPEGSPFEDFFEEFMERRGGGAAQKPSSSLGSGFIVDAANGYIVTNNHVIKNAEDIQITLQNEVTLKATIVGTDEKTDLAVIKVNPEETPLSQVDFGNSNTLRVGDWTLAIGNPFGLGGTVTAGIISARARDIDTGPYDDYLQTDASINRGNSGGPLFDMNGKVIGVNTAIFSPTGGSVGIGFSIPAALAEPVVNQIIKYGRTRRGWLGVRIQTVTPEIAESFGLDKARGALISSVSTDGPADKGGIIGGDIILRINEQAIPEVEDLPRIVAENDVGAEVPVIFWRDGKEHTANVIIGELEKAEEAGLTGSTLKSDGGGTKVEKLGLTLKAISQELRAEYNIGPTVKGVLISNVEKMSEALDKGLKRGDVIVEVNQQPVTDPSSIVETIDKAKANNRKSVLVLVNSAGSVRFVALKLK